MTLSACSVSTSAFALAPTALLRHIALRRAFGPARCGRSLTSRHRLTSVRVTVTATSPTPSTPPSTPVQASFPTLGALWAFTRPHTIYGSALSVLSMTLIAHLLSPLPLPIALLQTLLPALFINVYIVGLNQLHDIPLDAINKPSLPLPSGALTVPQARFVVRLSLLIGLAFCAVPSATPALRAVLILSALLGHAYSAPPLRLKRFALPAAASILAVRGLIVNAGFYLHASGASGGGVHLLPALASLPPLVVFACAFFLAFGLVIALLKDVPDIDGDRVFGIRTFSVRVGKEAVWAGAHAVIAAMYAAAAYVVARIAGGWVGAALGAVHVLVGAGVLWRATQVDLGRQEEVTRHYMDVWKVFYLEYLLLPIAAL